MRANAMTSDDAMNPHCRIRTITPTDAGRACPRFMRWLADRFNPPPADRDWLADRFEVVQ